MNTTTDTTNDPSIRILKKDQAPKLTPAAKGLLTYHIGYDESQNAFLVRVTANETGGFFSYEWVGVDAVIEHITEVAGGKPFKAIQLKDLYESKGGNNHGFVAAVLRNEGILVAIEFKPLSSLLGDVGSLRQQMQPLVDEGVAFVD